MSFVSPAAQGAQKHYIHLDISNVLENKEYEEKEGTQDFTLEGSVAPFWKMEQPEQAAWEQSFRESLLSHWSRRPITLQMAVITMLSYQTWDMI